MSRPRKATSVTCWGPEVSENGFRRWVEGGIFWSSQRWGSTKCSGSIWEPVPHGDVCELLMRHCSTLYQMLNKAKAGMQTWYSTWDRKEMSMERVPCSLTTGWLWGSLSIRVQCKIETPHLPLLYLSLFLHSSQYKILLKNLILKKQLRKTSEAFINMECKA